MASSLSLKVVFVFLVCIKYSTTLERCDSNVDCDEGFICCKITKLCVSKCTESCLEDSDCGSGKCCNSNNTCTDTNCSKDKPASWRALAVSLVAILLAPLTVFGMFICCLCYLNKKGKSSEDTSSSTSWHGGGVMWYRGHGGDCGGGGGGGGSGGCGGDGGGGCGV